MTAPAIVTEHLTREFRRRGQPRLVAVDDLDVTIEQGTSVGYIGANGAGKSTTIKMLTGILVPTSGTVRTCGLDPLRRRKELARHVGVVFGQRSQLWWDLPTAESFTILAAIHRLTPRERDARTTLLVDELELGDFLTTPVRQLSLGQRMRAEIAAALLHSPSLLILDEPTIGLDVLSKQRLREFLRHEQRERGTTILLTTHDMGDVQRLCERVLVVDQGRLAYDGTLPGLAATVEAGRVLVVDVAAPSARLDGLGLRGMTYAGSEGEGLRHRFSFDSAQVTVAQALSAIGEHADVVDLSIEEPNIEDVVRQVYRRSAGGTRTAADARN